MTTPAEPSPIEPEAELIGAQDQSRAHLPDDAYDNRGDDDTGEDEERQDQEENPPA